MSTILVVGNGFDLALGFNTTYKQFIDAVIYYQGRKPNFFWPFKHAVKQKFKTISLHNYLYRYFKDNSNEYGNINWIDLEGELYNYVQSKKGQIIECGLVEEDRASFLNLVYGLHAYLTRLNEIKYDEIYGKGEDFCVLQLLKSLNENKSFDKAYTFNYTDLASRLIEFGKFSESNLPIITYVHGSLSPSSNGEPGIVLGISSDSDLPKEYSFLQKIHSPIVNDDNLALDLISSTEIIFFGLSMGRIDFEYFTSFFKEISEAPLSCNKKFITIFTKGEEMVYSIASNLSEMGISLRRLKERAHFNIIDTHEVKFEGSPHRKLFDELTKRLAST